MGETQRVDYLDGWRGTAILLVLIAHYRLTPSILGHGLDLGGPGVELFFVLSGRLMAEILFVRHMGIGLFYWRRLARIFPALFMFIVILFVLSPHVPEIPITSLDIILAITTTANYFPVSGTLSHLWSICVEEHAYIFLSLVALVIRRITFSPIVLLAAATAACMLNGLIQTLIFHRTFWQVYAHSDVRIASVLVSATLYLYLRKHPLKLTGASRFLPTGAVFIGCALVAIHSVPSTVKFTVATFLLAFGLNTIEQTIGIVLRFLRSPVMRYLGILSFSLYLWQQPPIFLLNSYPLIAVLAGVILVAVLSFVIVEKPLRATLNRLYAARPVQAPPPIPQALNS
jgi:peptidoglycan/LPS O-acetylase OafA/YrhL